MFMRKTLLFLAVCGLLSGCTSYKKSQYLRHDEVLEAVKQYGMQYDYRVMPKDELTITVSTSDPEASASFYRRLGQSKVGNGNNSQGYSNAKLLDYLVDNNGCIDYPILGMLKVEGMTTRECEEMLRGKLRPYLNEDPTVTVRALNFHYSVLGEVGKPGVFTAENERVTIFEALAQAGDMTLFSNRKDVKLLREDAEGRRKVVHLDLTESDITLSPYYYIQQNDVIYVRTKRAKVRSNAFSSNSSMWISLLSLASSITSVILVGTLNNN